MSGKPKIKPKMIVVGWDGATWDLINPLVEQGRLPNLAALRQRGSWGPFLSTVPPFTPVAWTSIATGVNPGQHGIFDAFRLDPHTGKNTFYNATQRRRPAIWRLLERAGYKVGVLNVPMTYPAETVDGFFVSGMFTPPGAPRFMHPPGLAEELANRFGPYELECPHDPSPARHLELLLGMVRSRTELALHLMERFDPDFFFLVYVAIDRAQHFAMGFLEPDHPQHAAHAGFIARVYEELDQSLGRLLAAMGPAANVMMVSDHGAGPLRRSLVLDNWLRREGYLHLKPGQSGAAGGGLVSRIGLRLLSLVDKAEAAKRRARGLDRGLNAFVEAIDWERTQAHTQGAAGWISLNRRAVPEERRELLLEELRQGLYALRDEDGLAPVEAVHLSREIYHGQALAEAPDMLIICAPGYQIKGPSEFSLFREKLGLEIFTDHRWSGRHEMNGIFLLAGPGARPGQVLADCKVVDAAPTALYCLDQPIPDYMDGRVLAEALDPALWAARPPRLAGGAEEDAGSAAVLSPEEEREVAERLRDLGYIE
jgi:predicted AlkP superfamily phosphohydrolase/phosphomutase